MLECIYVNKFCHPPRENKIHVKVNCCFSDRKGVPFVAFPFFINLANYIFQAIQDFQGQPVEEMHF